MNKKICIIAAALAAFFMLPLFGLTAYATELDGTPEDGAIVEETPDAEAADTEMLETDELPEIEEYPDAPVTDYPETPPKPFTPDGTGTVIDNAEDSDGKEFYTVMTPDEHVFYLVIDKQRNADNVYFLNAVTIADLAVLAELPVEVFSSEAAPAPVAPEVTEQPEETPAPPADETEQGGGMGMYIFIIAVAVIGGVAGWYFKIYRPKQQGAAGGDEYEPPTEDNENDYADGWGDDSEEADKSPLWGEDGESGDADE